MQYDVIIIGAGAAGLMAMQELVATGHKVCLLEASDSLGGRINTIRREGFEGDVETGAEFIHGNASVTLGLLKQANISYTPVSGDMIPIEKGVWFDEPENDRSIELLNEKISLLTDDCTIRHFLDIFFAEEEYEEVRTFIQHLAEGYCLADIDTASIFSFQKDISHFEETDYRIAGGYQSLINYLFETCEDKATVHFSSEVYNIMYRENDVLVKTKDGKSYQATKLIITVSAGVLKSADISFNPKLEEHDAAIKQLGFGSVVKILLQFSEPFWENKAKNLIFALSDEAIPTWWTQMPQRTCLLTGWLGGPGAKHASQLGGDEIYEIALKSLSNIFSVEISRLRSLLTHHKIVCWDNNPYIKGGYSFNTLLSEPAKEILRKPVMDTIFFAGEAVYSGEFQGTVEAALVSGRDVARQIEVSSLINRV
jgi:monoamine oxidase